MHTKFWFEHLKGRDHLKDQGIDGNAVFTWILNSVGECGLDSFGFRYGPVADYCETVKNLRAP
jgi:hypothetical protein